MHWPACPPQYWPAEEFTGFTADIADAQALGFSAPDTIKHGGRRAVHREPQAAQFLFDLNRAVVGAIRLWFPLLAPAG